MIFVAVGTQFPFNRLVRCIDDWAERTPEVEVVAQTGDKHFSPHAIKAYDFIEPIHFARFQQAAELLVGHAGIGTILGALELRKPVIIMPRLASYGEHRNDHQLATAKLFKGKPGIHVVFDERELANLLDRRTELEASVSRLSPEASPELIEAVRRFIEGER